MTRIYFVRHCEAEGNICRRAQTIFDGLVTLKGVAQSEALRKRFHDEKIDAVYSSDSYRARATADPIAEDHGLKPRYRFMLREYVVGIWDGMPNGNAEREFGDIIIRNNANLGDLWFPGGDTTDSIERRSLRMLHEILTENENKTIVVVSHAVMTRQMLCIAKGYPRTGAKDVEYGDNTAVSLVEYEDGKFNVRYIADTSHLTPELKKPWEHDCGSINMTIDNAVLPDDSDRIVRFSMKMDECRGREIKDKSRYIEDASRRIEDNPDYVTLYALNGEYGGILYLRKDCSFSDEYEVVDDYYFEEGLCEKQLHIQALGHAIHVARKNCRKYVAFPKAVNKWDQMILDRFPFEEIPDHPNYMRLCILIPPCRYPVI